MAVELVEPEKIPHLSKDISTPSPYGNGSLKPMVKGDISAFIGPGVEFKGVISYKGSVQIDGKLEGEIHTDGMLLVGEQAIITAKISAGSVVSKGQISGDIVAKEQIQFLKSAKMEGSLNTPQLSMEDGVLLNGTVEMKPTDKRNSPSF